MSSTLGASLLRTVLSDGTLKILGSGLDKGPIIVCVKNHVQQSMSRAGCPYDNAPMERFYNTLKNEYFNLRKFKTVEQLAHGIYQFIYGKYNRKRPHSYNNGLTPHAARMAA